MIAAAFAFGVDGTALMRTRDPAEMMVLRIATERAIEMVQQRDENLAVRIINRLAEATKKGSKK